MREKKKRTCTLFSKGSKTDLKEKRKQNRLQLRQTVEEDTEIAELSPAKTERRLPPFPMTASLACTFSYGKQRRTLIEILQWVFKRRRTECL